MTTLPPLGPPDSGLLATPHGLLDLVLGAPGELAVRIARGPGLARLNANLLLASAGLALPYGCVLELGRCWRVAVLLLGPLLLCLPALHVFGAYVGFRAPPLQRLALTLSIACTAAAFSLGFAPILWFLTVTEADGTLVPLRLLSRGLLAVSLLAGLGQLWRCLYGSSALTPRGVTPLLLLAWQALVVLLAHRMAVVLDLY